MLLYWLGIYFLITRKINNIWCLWYWKVKSLFSRFNPPHPRIQIILNLTCKDMVKFQKIPVRGKVLAPPTPHLPAGSACGSNLDFDSSLRYLQFSPCNIRSLGIRRSLFPPKLTAFNIVGTHGSLHHRGFSFPENHHVRLGFNFINDNFYGNKQYGGIMSKFLLLLVEIL